MSVIVSTCMCQHCGEQQFRNTVMCSCAPYTIFFVVKLDLCIRAVLLDHILALKKKYAYARVYLVANNFVCTVLTDLLTRFC